ncbi:cytochrome b5 [Pluteus cervinus]|uniref:Cytochrome b5 n=1 Tax=Pluteus cervinus TaxID=181527 RepID=A0ACD3AN75_9AGAR|nr:cytochrome b5 [Pluteus cervinus]
MTSSYTSSFSPPSSPLSIGLSLLAFLVPLTYFSYRQFVSKYVPKGPIVVPAEDHKQPVKTMSIMQPPKEVNAPKDDVFTKEELKKFDGSDPEKPIYVAIKGTIFDVSHKRDVYGAGKSYNIFAGKDGSKGLGKSSLNPEDAVADYSDLDEGARKVLDDWYIFFEKRYSIVGKIEG